MRTRAEVELEWQNVWLPVLRPLRNRSLADERSYEEWWIFDAATPEALADLYRRLDEWEDDNR